MNIEKSMMLITSTFKGHKTFKAIPLTKECPYNEITWNPIDTEVGIVSKEKMHMHNLVPKVDDEGFPIPSKRNRQIMAQEKRMMDVPYEYTVPDISDAEVLINMFCINSDTFDWKKYIAAPKVSNSEFTEKIVE